MNTALAFAQLGIMPYMKLGCNLEEKKANNFHLVALKRSPVFKTWSVLLNKCCWLLECGCSF